LDNEVKEGLKALRPELVGSINEMSFGEITK